MSCESVRSLANLGQDDLAGVAVGSLLGPVGELGPGVALHGALPGDGEPGQLHPGGVHVRRLGQASGAYGEGDGLGGTGSRYGRSEHDGSENGGGAQGGPGGPAPDS
jgi:hypothetical protein